MPIDEETRRQGLVALLVAAAELIEDAHPELVEGVNGCAADLRHRAGLLALLGRQISAFGAAAEVLAEEDSSTRPQSD